MFGLETPPAAVARESECTRARQQITAHMQVVASLEITELMASLPIRRVGCCEDHDSGPHKNSTTNHQML